MSIATNHLASDNSNTITPPSSVLHGSGTGDETPALQPMKLAFRLAGVQEDKINHGRFTVEDLVAAAPLLDPLVAIRNAVKAKVKAAVGVKPAVKGKENFVQIEFPFPYAKRALVPLEERDKYPLTEQEKTNDAIAREIKNLLENAKEDNDNIKVSNCTSTDKKGNKYMAFKISAGDVLKLDVEKLNSYALAQEKPGSKITEHSSLPFSLPHNHVLA